MGKGGEIARALQGIAIPAGKIYGERFRLPLMCRKRAKAYRKQLGLCMEILVERVVQSRVCSAGCVALNAPRCRPPPSTALRANRLAARRRRLRYRRRDDLCIMRVCRKRGRAVEGTSLENWRRCEPFVSSNLTASAKICNKSPTSWGFFSSSHRRNLKTLFAGVR